MIDEKKLIEDYDRITFTDEIQKRQIKNLIEHLIELQPKVGDWIPCSERLPEDFEKVLTCDEIGNRHIMEHHHDFKYPFNIFPNHPHFFQVVAWQPLPEPYKEGGGVDARIHNKS